MTLCVRYVRASLIGLLASAALIFIPAGTLDYWQGWLFLIVFTVATTIIGLYLALKDPALLERRLNAGPTAETRPMQKLLVSLLFVSFLALIPLSVLDYRFGWSEVPVSLTVLGNVLVALGLMVTLWVLRENSYSASTVRTMEGQKVISTGPYAVIRHPMYLGALIMVLGMPPALGSYWGLLLALATVPVLMLRIRDEEKMLVSELSGYASYAAKVRFRLLPGIW